MTEKKRKLDPKIYLEAARRIDELQSFSIMHAITMAVYDANAIYNPQDYIDAWRKQFEILPGYPLFPGSNMTPNEQANSLRRMAVIAEKDNEKIGN